MAENPRHFHRVGGQMTMPRKLSEQELDDVDDLSGSIKEGK